MALLLINSSVAEKICGTSPWTFRCPSIFIDFSNQILFFTDFDDLVDTQCGTYPTRLCLTESRGPTLTGIIVFSVIAVLILLIIIKACLPCCPRIRGYRSVSADQARSGAVVCTVAATHC